MSKFKKSGGKHKKKEKTYCITFKMDITIPLTIWKGRV
jgi:hypothetical protein